MFERAKRFAIVLSALLTFAGNRATAQKVVVADPALAAEIDRRTAAIADKVTGWRHDIHQLVQAIPSRSPGGLRVAAQ
jgi:hypothetical protein